MLDMDDIECRMARVNSLSQAGIGTCSLALQVGFFFDASGRNILADEQDQRLTNVGRLFRAHPREMKVPQTSSYAYNKFYIPGLGTPLEDTPAERLDSVLDARQEALVGDVGDALLAQAKETAVEAVKGDWSVVLSDKLSDLITLKSGVQATVSAITTGAQRALAEAVTPIRDSSLVAELLMTGVDARVDLAKSSFKQIVADAKRINQLPFKLIQVSVFGADLGATLARRFIDELLETVCTNVEGDYRYEEGRVEVIFAGLFDCSRRGKLDQGEGVTMMADAVGTVFKATAPATSLFGAKVIEYDQPLHPAVKQALHLVAAHERRVSRPLLPLGPLKSGWREELCPGISEDVTGGLLPSEQRPSAELCRVPLRRMFDTARQAQVPFPNFRTLNKKDPYVASYFVMRDNLAGYSVRDFSDEYMKWVCTHYPDRKYPSPASFATHLYAYCAWLGEKYHEYLALLREAGQFNVSERACINEQWGWLRHVMAEAKQIERNNSSNNGQYNNRAGEAGRIMLKAAKNVIYSSPAYGAKPLAFGINAFFNYFMHDVSSAELTDATVVQQQNAFFVPRGIETLATDGEVAA